MKVGSRVCPSSNVSPAVMVIVQTVAEMTLVVTFRSSGAIRILHKPELCVHWFSCTCVCKEILSKSKIHHTGTWLEAPWPPCCLCYRPAVFFQHLRIITLSYRRENFGGSLKHIINLSKFIFLIAQVLNGVTWICLPSALLHRYSELSDPEDRGSSLTDAQIYVSASASL